MSEERPVPRRESPWGLPEGDKRQPKAHRCNDRVEDVVQACFEGNPFKTVPGPFKLFWQCMRSNPGYLLLLMISWFDPFGASFKITDNLKLSENLIGINIEYAHCSCQIVSLISSLFLALSAALILIDYIG